MISSGPNCDDRVTDLTKDPFLMRRLYMGRACRRGLPEVIEGITFDLNHPDLDRSNWEPADSLGDYPGMGLEPSIAYPWTTPEQIDRMAKSGGFVALASGDRLVIRKVVPFETKALSIGKLDHPHHRETRLVFLDILRGDERLCAPGYWLFTGQADVLTPIILDELSNVRRALLKRFEQATGLEDLEDHVTDLTEADWNAQFALESEDLQHTARMLWKAEDWQDNAGMAFGYLIGRAEARQGRKVVSQLGSNNLRSTGDDSRKAAITIIDQAPGITRRLCAERVRDVNGKTIKSLLKTIAPLFQEGDTASARPDREAVEAFRARLFKP
jgi:hypothetical protein